MTSVNHYFTMFRLRLHFPGYKKRYGWDICPILNSGSKIYLILNSVHSGEAQILP